MVRLGVAGLMPPDVQAVTQARAERIRSLGFTGVSCFLTDPEQAHDGELRLARDTLLRAGVAVAQANARYERLCDADEHLRQRAIVQVRAAIHCAKTLGADNLYIRPGSLNKVGHWYAHPDNTAASTIDRLIDSLRQVSHVAEEQEVTLAIEGHTLSPLNTPKQVRQVIDATGSPRLKFNSDPVNFVSTLQEAFDPKPVVDGLFASLGDVTVAAHLKDMLVEDRLVLHIAECLPGRGNFPLGYFLQRFASVAPSGWVLIEHLADELIPEAKVAVDRAAASVGMRWEL